MTPSWDDVRGGSDRGDGDALIKPTPRVRFPPEPPNNQPLRAATGGVFRAEGTMATLLVGYDLNQPGQAYGPLWEKLKSYETWWHCLDSTWIIKASLRPMQLLEQLQPLIDPNDEVLVVEITDEAAAWIGFNDDCTSWLRSNL